MKILHKSFITAVAWTLMCPALMRGADGDIPVSVTMNATSKTMTLKSVEGDKEIAVGEPSGYTYSFEVPEGKYVLTAYANETTVNGTIVLDVNSQNYTFSVLTNTAYATNSGWVLGEDYTISNVVCSRMGDTRIIEPGQSTTANRQTFLAFTGDSYTSTFKPSEARRQEGYGEGYKTGTLTANATVSYAIALTYDYTVTVPADAYFQMGRKNVHFTDFTIVEPESESTEGNIKTLTYKLLQSQVYNYRTWKDNGLTMAGYFTMQSDASKRPTLNFTDADYKAYDPGKINHDVQSNNGYETGDIFLNINEKGFLSMTPGSQFKLHAMRTWELTDNTVNNYFIEPDFHYTVLDLNGEPTDKVIEISQKPGSPWADIKAKAQGTVIVLVHYDAIKLNFYSGAEKKEYAGGEFWGALWPENTGIFVVSVGNAASQVTPEFVINEEYNSEKQKMAGKYVDAEHDVFYYLEETDGYPFTFEAPNAGKVTVAYPEMGSRHATYKGFTADGVTDNGEGRYTVLLKEGRQIVKIDDAQGNSTYQVLTAKTCRREISNLSRPGSRTFQPGDEVSIQYYGLRHPANKIAGIYNMSAYVTYQGKPNGSSLILGSNQYTFGSSAAAQHVKLTIADDYDAAENPVMVLDDGVIQVTGYGDPIGNHRTIDPVAGRSPNFTAISHQTYFGAIPEVRLDVLPKFMFDITVAPDIDGCDIMLSYNGKKLEPDDAGHFAGSYGTYSLFVGKKGYRASHREITLAEGDEAAQTFAVEMEAAPEVWDGATKTQPTLNESGYYKIESPEHLAWFANEVNNGAANQNAILAADIDLGGYFWTPMGMAKSKPFKGVFTGAGHTVSGLWGDQSITNTEYMGLFGYVLGSSTARVKITGVTVDGYVSGSKYAGGIVAYLYRYADMDTCANYATVQVTDASSGYAGGIIGYIYNKDMSLHNSYNVGAVSGGTKRGGLVGRIISSAGVENVFNVGEVADGPDANACFGSAAKTMTFTNAFAVKDCTNAYGYTLVDEETMRSGEIAYTLGDAFGQALGEDDYPVFGAPKVYYSEESDVYYNDIDGLELVFEDFDERVDPVAKKLTLSVGDTYLLKVTATPKGAELPELEWSTTDGSVASIEPRDNESALVTAVKPGNISIKVSHKNNPDINDTCDLTVPVTTAIDGIYGDEDPTAGQVYDLQGRRATNLQPGTVYVGNGKKFILPAKK